MNCDCQILFVDDDEEDHLIMLQYFEDLGKQKFVRFINSGHAALTFLETASEAGSLPNLIVLDLNMPVLNGTQTLLQIKRTKSISEIPVIILSTSENESEKRKCLSLGAEDYLVKPATYMEGVKLIEKLTAYLST